MNEHTKELILDAGFWEYDDGVRIVHGFRMHRGKPLRSSEKFIIIATNEINFDKYTLDALEKLGLEFFTARIPHERKRQLELVFKETPVLWKREAEERNKKLLEEAGEICAP